MTGTARAGLGVLGLQNHHQGTEGTKVHEGVLAMNLSSGLAHTLTPTLSLREREEEVRSRG